MPTVYFAPQIQPLLENAQELRQDLGDDPVWRLITPNRNAANALSVTEYALKSLAVEILQTCPLKIAPPLVAQYHLRQALRETLSPQDEKGVARVWFPTLQNILRARPSLPQFQDLSQRAGQVLATTRSYQHLLRQAGYIDEGEMYWQAIAQRPPKLSLVIYGYFELRDDELAFIQALAAQDSILFLIDGDHRLFSRQTQLREQLKRRGWRERQLTVNPPTKTAPLIPSQILSEAFLESTPISPEQTVISAEVYPNSEAEARGVLAQIKQLLAQGVCSRDIVIVAANDSQWGERLVDIAWEYDISLRLPYKIAIADTRVGAWIALLLEVLERRWSFEETCRFLQHPLSRTLGDNLWARRQGSRPANFATWRSLILTEKNIDIAPLELPQQAHRSQWLSQLQGIFKLFELRQRVKPWARESLAYRNWLEGLEDYGALGEETLVWEQFREEILSLLNLLTTVAAPGREGVELHSPQSIAGATYDYVFVIDGREGNLPKPIVNDLVLDFYERRQLQAQGIPLTGAAEAAQQETFAFYTLLQTPKKRFVFSYAKTFSRHGSYEKSEPSSYFQQLGLNPEPTSLPIIPSAEIARQLYLRRSSMWIDDVLTKALHAWEVEQQRESAGPPNEYDGIVGISFDYSEHWFSASQLTQLGQCPFKWFANKLLKLAEMEEAEADLDPGLRGSLYHKALEIALKAFQDDPSLNLADDDNLHTWFMSAEREVARERKVNFSEFSAWEYQRRELIKTLKKAIENPEFLPSSTEIIALEIHFEEEFQGLKIRGNIDRIDRREEGLTLIDYKSGASISKIKDSEGKANIDLQLPLYQAVGAASLYPEEAVHKTMYYSIGKAKDISPNKKITEGELMEILERFKAHFQTGSYPVAPDIKREACIYCANDLVCRQGERLQRKGV